MASSFHRQDERIIVGRERERARLRELLDDAAAGHGSLVLISGEAGVGKTTLVDDLIDEAEQRDCLILSGACYDLITTPPYGPWIEILDSYLQTDDLPPVPPALREPNGMDQARSQEQLFRIITGFVGDISASVPLILILEDLHWADHASIELLRYLARRVSQRSLLVVASYRDEKLDRTHLLFTVLPLLVREARAKRLELQPLDCETLAIVIDSRYPLADNERKALSTFLFRHTEGNPLFAIELLRSLERENNLVEDEHGWRVRELDEVVPPPLVFQMFERQLATLKPAWRKALEIGAVLGQDIDPNLWRKLAGLDRADLSMVIEQALSAGLIEQIGRSRLRFRHALIREVLYQGMVLPRRTQAHRLAAEALAASEAPEPDRIAFHFQQANDPRAVEWLIRAGERAQRAFAHTIAADRFEAALRLSGDDPSTDRDRAWLSWQTSRMYRWSDHNKQQQYFNQAAQLARQANEPSLIALCALVRGVWQCGNGQSRRGIQEIEHGRKVWRGLTDDERITAFPQAIAGDSAFALNSISLADEALRQLSRIYPGTGLLSSWLAYTGRFADAIAVAEELVDQVNEIELPPDLRLITCRGGYAGLAVAYAALGQPERSHEMWELVRETHRVLSAHVGRLVSSSMQFWFVTLPYYTDNLTERRLLSATTNDAVTRLDKAFPAMVSSMPWFEIVDGNWHEAKSLLREFLKHPVGWSWRLPFLSFACWLERHCGESDIAWSRIHECLPAGPRTEPGDEQFMFVVPLLRRAIELSLDAEELERALPWLKAHDRWMDWAGAVAGQTQGRLLWARYWLQSGDPAEARRDAMHALDFASDPRQPLNLLASHRFLGELDILEQRFDEAEHHLTLSLDLAEASAIPYERAQCLFALAEFQAARGDDITARAFLDEVRQIAQSLGAAPLMRQVDQLRHRLSGTIYPAGLSAREVEVLQRVAAGLSDAEIADQLYISPRTVNRHTQSIYNKLNVNSRVAATRFALDHELT